VYHVCSVIYYARYLNCRITVAYWIMIITPHFILSSSKELTSWAKLQVEIFCKASRKRALQKICTCSQKLAKILHIIILKRVACVQCDILCKVSELCYKSSGIRSPMPIGWLFLEHSHQHKLWCVI
jgi:hypothetical protein